MGRGRGLLRYFLAQNCLGDVLQTAISDVKTLKMFFNDGALIRHSGMQHVIESLYGNIFVVVETFSSYFSFLRVEFDMFCCLFTTSSGV